MVSAPTYPPVEDVYGPIPKKLKLTSWDDMCVERGGCTLIIFLAIATTYLLIRNKLGKKNPNAEPFYENPTKFFPKLFALIERHVVVPFVPSELHIYMMWVYIWFLFVTIPMGINRYYRKKWEHDLFAIQGPLNVISFIFGCKSLDLTAIPYTELLEDDPPLYSKPSKAEDKYGRIDWFLFMHLTIGLAWLTIGFVQIFKARDNSWSYNLKQNWEAHKKFGRVAVTSAFLHICMMLYITIENPVEQHLIILLGYAGMVYQGVITLYQGIKNAVKMRNSEGEDKEEYKQLHEQYMVVLFLRIIRGSGTIRFTSWLLWIFGHFFDYETRKVFERGVCQTYAKDGYDIGNASDCWTAVFFNILLTNILNDWLELLYIDMKRDETQKKVMEKERKKLWIKFDLRIILTIPAAFFMFYDERIGKWLETVKLPFLFEFVIRNIAEIWGFVMVAVIFFVDLPFDIFEDSLLRIFDFLLPGKKERVKED